MSSTNIRSSESVGVPHASSSDGSISVQFGLGQTSAPPSGHNELLQKFLQGQPVALGTTQIMIGICSFFCGIALAFAGDVYMALAGVPFWTAVAFIISGSLSVAFTKKPKISLAKITLAFNIISALVAGTAMIFYCLDIFVFRFYYFDRCDSTEKEKEDHLCLEILYQFLMLNYSIKVLLLLFCLLELCIAISLSMFGCKTVCRDSFSYQSIVQPVSIHHDDHMTVPLVTTASNAESC